MTAREGRHRRAPEQVEVVALDRLDPADVDMRTLLIFGSSQTRIVDRGTNQRVVYTPRRYEVTEDD